MNARALAIGAVVALCASAAPLRAQEPARASFDFAREVLPILEARCIECHGAPETDARGRVKKAKGGLRLDGAAWIRKGGETGRVVVARQPEQSELLRRVTLPADDADLMPPKGDPLSAEQIASLRAWIGAGAEFGAWTGAAGPAEAPAAAGAGSRAGTPSAPSARTAALQALGEGLEPLAPTVLAKVSSEKLRLESALPGTALLRASFPAHRTEIGDAEVLALAPLAQHLAVLDLARAKLGAKSIDLIARMPRLVKLDLADTGLGAQQLEKLAGALPALRELNLNGTQADDGSLAWLASLPALEDLYLWRSAATSEGIAKLRAAKPALRVRHALELPEPPPEADRPAGRRRR